MADLKGTRDEILADLLWVAQLQTAQIGSEGNLIKLRSAQRTNRVRLYQVLGGGFDPTPAAALPTPRSAR